MSFLSLEVWAFVASFSEASEVQLPFIASRASDFSQIFASASSLTQRAPLSKASCWARASVML